MSISIVTYTDEYKDAFTQLNLYWLDKYHLTESHDLQVLDNPQATIIDRGGAIYLALHGEMVVGSAAIMKVSEGHYELAKMAVSPMWHRKGIGKLLLSKCIETAKEWGVKKISLFSNHQLQAAIGMYRTFGFQDVPVTDSPFVTADVKMELDL